MLLSVALRFRMQLIPASNCIWVVLGAAHPEAMGRRSKADDVHTIWESTGKWGKHVGDGGGGGWPLFVFQICVPPK